MSSLRIGLLADSQYCDIENGFNFTRTNERYYRNSLNHIDAALNYFSRNECSYVLQLGDLIDGKCFSLQQTKKALKVMENKFESIPDSIETFHVVGNHELYNLSRKEFKESFLANSLKKYQKEDILLNYFKADLSKDFVLIILDEYDLSVLNKNNDSDVDENMLKARQILSEKNKNSSWNDPVGIEFARFVAFNGGVGERQLKWLDEQLKLAQQTKKMAIVVGHIPLLDESPNPICQVWNYEEVLNVMDRYDCVKLYICGHSHEFELVEDRCQHNFLHLTMPGIIEANLDTQPYSYITVDRTGFSIAPMKGIYKSKNRKFKF